MPRYFFKVDSDTDCDGVEFPTLTDAKCAAVTFAGELLCDAAKTFWDDKHLDLTVTNDVGLTLFSLTFVGTEAAAIADETRVLADN